MKVLLVVIDAASPRVVCPAVQTGRLPVLHRLAEAGSMHEASATIFPSITPAATSSIITGAYPSEHGIAGAAWFDERRQEVAYYGDDFWVAAREGFGAFVHDFLVRLNGDRLKAPTLLEIVEREGRRAASLNYLVYRGNVEHRVRVPKLLALLPGVSFGETVRGPSVLCIGDFVSTPTPHGRKLRDEGGLLHRFGMDDESSGALLRQLAADRALPEFTVVYFADNDFRSHEVGPYAALPVVERVDQALGEAFEAAGGLDSLLSDTCVVVTSDHGHCEILSDPDRAVVRLDRVLGDFRQARFGRPWQDGDEIMICPNMRAAQIYVRDLTPVRVDRVVRALLAEPRVDQVLWRTTLSEQGAPGYIAASSKGRLEFQRGSGGAASGQDAFGTRWTWKGDRGVLGFEVDGHEIVWGAYPNAFERIAGGLDARHGGEIWITAAAGCEFEVPDGRVHLGGGSHGALHALDSLSPVIVAGGPRRLQTARPFRSVDIAPLCLEALGVPFRYKVGDPRG